MKREEQMMGSAEKYADEICGEGYFQDKILAMNFYAAGWQDADAHPNWISVEDELPKPWMVGAYSTDYVIAYDGDDLLFAYYDFSQKEWHGENYEKLLIEPTHWMPLPAAPRKEDKK